MRPTKRISQGLKRHTKVKMTRMRATMTTTQGKKKERLLSIMLISLEKRFRMRPTGLLLKKMYLARTIRCNILEWSFLL